MKKQPIFCILLTIVMIFATSCEKDDDASNTTTLDNTRWECTYDVTFHNAEFQSFPATVTDVIKFGTNHSGEMEEIIEVPSAPEENQHLTQPFTFTFDDPNGYIITNQDSTKKFRFTAYTNYLILYTSDETNFSFTYKKT